MIESMDVRVISDGRSRRFEISWVALFGVDVPPELSAVSAGGTGW